MWSKAQGKLHGIYEGDESVVNVIEGHPSLPLIAVSGIDTTVKVSTSTVFCSSINLRYPSFFPQLVDPANSLE